MIANRRRITGLAVAGCVLVAAALSYIIVPRLTTITITAEFENTNGLYEGDDVRVMGVTVGDVTSIRPDGDRVNVTLSVDNSQPIPADAKAVVISQSLVAARFVQLAPAYTSGATMASGDRIPLSRTAVPVEWDQIKEQLSTLTEALGPSATDPVGPLGELTANAAANLDGQGESLNHTLTALSDAMTTLSDGRSDLFGAVRNLSVFVSALSASGQQIVSFNNRMSTVTDVLADNKAHLVTVQIPNRSMRYGTGSFGSMTNESSSRRLVSYCAAHETNLPVIIS